MTAIIIGAGIAGLAMAIRLARLGYNVQVFEANDGPGGKMGVLSHDGYRFDTGPSLFTLPALVEELFELCGEDVNNHFEYRRLDPITRYFWEDGKQLTAWADAAHFAAECEQVFGEPAANILKFLRDAETKYQIAAPFFLERSLHKPGTYLNSGALKALTRLPRLQTGTTMAKAIDRSISSPYLRQLFRRYATYNGSDPWQAPATLNLIPHLEFNVGAYLPKGGMYSIAHSLEQLAVRQGVTFHYRQPVDKLVIEKGQAVGVAVNNEVHQADVVVCNLDVYSAYRQLMPDQKRRTQKQEPSSSALIFYWGMQRTFPQLDVHNIFFSADYRAEFAALFQERTLPADPTVYVSITSKLEKGDAPAGCENWFVMINAPSLNGQDWQQLIPQARKNILEKLGRILQTDLEPLIANEEQLTPELIESRTGSYRGALYGTASNSRFAAFLRHPNFSRKISGLYFCGGSVHPGGGIPLCLLSAKITAKAIGEK